MVSDSSQIVFIVCCFNSAERLPQTLACLARQGRSACCVVVDNASRDGTAKVAAEVWREAGRPFPLQVVHEPIPGLVHARKCGLAAAEAVGADIVCFVDDDNRLEGDWVGPLSRIFSEHPEVGAVGGFGRPVFSGECPAWFMAIAGGFACGGQGPAGLVPLQRGHLYGAGLALRMTAWRAIKDHFAPRLTGRVGGRMLAGDDTELCLFIQEVGWRLWHAPELRFDHIMPANRLTIAAVCAMHEGFGLSSRYLAWRKARLEGRRLRQIWLSFVFAQRLYSVLKYVIWVFICRFRPEDAIARFRCHEARGCIRAI
jgi:glycosyltransferase involved in cell wall biosynthesis